jgi:hypothetical protein
VSAHLEGRLGEAEWWVLLGDVGTVDEDGVVTVLGRGSPCINTGGEKVYRGAAVAERQGGPPVGAGGRDGCGRVTSRPGN